MTNFLSDEDLAASITNGCPDKAIESRQDAIKPVLLPPRLVIVLGNNKGRQFVVGKSVVRVGRAPDNDIVLCDVFVSRHHAVIKRTERGLQLFDLGGKNPTLVNDHCASSSHLCKGDLIKIGQTTLHLC